MSLKSPYKLVTVAFSTFLIAACGGEIFSPAGPGGIDSDGDGVPDSIDPRPNFASDEDRVLSEQHAELRFVCNEANHAPTTLRRLSRDEVANTLRAVLRASTSDATANDVMKSAEGALSSYPTGAVTKHAPFGVMDQSVSEDQIGAMVKLGTSIGQALTSSPQRINELLGSCATARNASADAISSCVDGFVTRFGKRLLRHNLSDQERSFFREVYASTGSSVDAAGLADVIAVMVNAPSFAYRVELGAKQVGGSQELYQLSDYEIASRLAFQFWRAGPDDELLAAADRGELSTDAGYTKALDRVLDDPRTSAGLEQFVREWLGLDKMKSLDTNNNDPTFSAFAGADKPNATLKEEMIQDVTKSFSFTMRDQGSLADWVESPYSFASSQQLAAIYKTPVWDGKGAPPRFPEGERAGLITRAALLATGTVNTSPIMKGVMIRERLLCDMLAPPPANAGKLPEASGEKTRRELTEALTEVPGTPCAGCHVTQINPLGYATEGFDALGRQRTEEPLFGADGKVIRTKPVDTRSVPHVRASDTTPSSGAKDLTSMLVDSGKVDACFAREWVRYSAARAENTETDGCELETIRSTLATGGSLREAMRRYALMPRFRQRYLPRS